MDGMRTAFEHIFVAVKCRGKYRKGAFPLINVALAVSQALATLTLLRRVGVLGVVF
jgi:hypothetical protein